MYSSADGITKTTFFLSDSRRMRLKSLAAKSGKTVTELLGEGAELVLAKYGALEDRSEFERRAKLAKDRLREGIYSGPAVDVDDVLYGRPRSARRRSKKK